MFVYTLPTRHRPLLRAGNPISGDHFRRKCGLSAKPRNIYFCRHHFSQIPSSQRFTLSPMAAGSNDSEDTDDMFDDLFKKYGKVVFRSNDQKSSSSEVDDDAESLSFAVALAKVASDVKAAELRVLFVKPLVYWTRFFIIATAFSRPQIDAIRSKMRDLAEAQYGRTASGDSKPNSWTLLDFGDVVVHIFLPQQRAFYNLEEFYGNATPIELPFENQRFGG
ncbi:protein Iojap, chloroplastic [Dorcoceras hygrometricum]|uniref:Protein Iojap, chloroplastic n=1 Tax=Dorcoceras hygrometricum TaxID=472368 RepID=A0A2Z7BNM7_9LAMI|nr:protein Iojap, chloroplastic [Dorcoceras hygrometricum]